jgi:hypothetical protein
MKTLTDIETQIDALKEVSSNALLKHGFSRSRQRIFDLSKSLDETWQNYKVIHGKTYHKELTLFVITRSALGLRYKSIVKRSGLKALVVHDCLTDLLNEKLIYKKVIDMKLIYRAKK